MQVEVHTDPGVFDGLRVEWDDLLARSYEDIIFLRPAWLKAWWQVFGPEGGLRVITVRDGGRLVGVAPFFLGEVMGDGAQAVPNVSYERPVPDPASTAHRTLLFVGGTEVSDYLDLIVDHEQGPAAYRAVFEAVQEMDWEWADLHCLPTASPTPELFGHLARAAGLQVAVAQEDVCPAIALPGTWAEYLAMLSKKDRHELRRKMRRVEESGRMQVLEATNPEHLDGQLQAFMALHEASTPDKADFMQDPRMRRFFQLGAHAALENGWLDLSFLILEGELAASIFCFRYRDAILVYNSGFDPQAWPRLAPGVALFGQRIKRAIESGQRTFDFMQGNERYKYDLGAQDRPIYRLLVRR